MGRLARNIGCVLVFLVADNALEGDTLPFDYLGPEAMIASPDGKSLHVALADARQIVSVDLATRKISCRVNVPSRPTGLAVSDDGRMLYVTCAAPKSTVSVIDTTSGRIDRMIRVGHTATMPVLGRDGKHLYVCNRFDDDVSILDLATGDQLARIDVTREPVAACLTPDGESLVVANHVPINPATDYYVASELTIINTETHEASTVQLPNGSSGAKSLCLSSDGRFAFVAHILSNFELVPSQLEQGWTNTNVVSVVDIRAKKRVKSLVLDDLYLGGANPWAVGLAGDERILCIAHAGTHEVSLVNIRVVLREMLREWGPTSGEDSPIEEDGELAFGGLYQWPISTGIPASMGMLEGLRHRVELACRGPRAMVIIGSKAYLAGYFSDTIDVLDLPANPPSGLSNDAKKPDLLVETIPLGPPPTLSTVRRGEMLFHDATICYQMWHSCATCHPDGRTDCLNWDLMNDGIGNPKNAKSLLFSHRTPPSMALGVRATAEEAVRAGFKHILFTERPEEESRAIDEYLKTLRPLPSPRLVDGKLSPAARRGKAVFHSDAIGCDRCHSGPLYTDGLMHTVNKAGPYDHRGEFDTPTLIELWRTAPYLHDGRYVTVRELLLKGEHGLTRKQIEQLTDAEVDDLVEFVLSL